MFCDLVGSTALSIRLDPEDMREVVRAYQRCCTDIITRAGGFVARYMGDGVLAYFGYPHAHEHDAERAVRAGLSLLEAVPRVKTATGGPLQVRIGIATGLVVVGDLIGEGFAQERPAVGETPNLAARLQALAEPGTVVISSSTRNLTGGLFDYRDLGQHSLKGFSEPVHVRQVLGLSKVESRFEAQHQSGTSPLLGRDEELDLLLRRWDEAKRGEGRVVLLTGEPGIGKSRIARALGDRLRSDPCTQLGYFCSPHHQSSALYPHIAQLNRAAGIERDDSVDVKLDKLQFLVAQSTGNGSQEMPLLAALLSIPGDKRYPLPEMTPLGRKERTLAALLSQLRGLSARQPVLAVYEDLHWIDPTSLELLSLAIDQIGNQRVMLVATARPEFTPPWPDHRHVSTISLNRFGRSECEALIADITKDRALPPEVRDQIVTRTDGVPLFVEELTKTVLESGLLRHRGDHYELTGPLPPMAIPSTLHASLLARLDRLATVKNIAQIASVIGREFSYPLLAAAAVIGERDLNAALAQLIAAELIYQRGVPPDATYQFKHALVQDAAYSTLGRGPRQMLHARVAQALEETSPEILEHRPQVIAHHLTEAGLAERAAGFWQRAGELSLRRSSVNEAIMHFSSGLRMVGAMAATPEAGRRELEIRLGFGTALNIAYGSSAPAVAEHYDRALTLAREFGLDKQLFRALWGSWYAKVTKGQTKPALALANELVDVGAQLGDEALILEAHHSRWGTCHLSGLLATTLADTERGIALYRVDQHRLHAYEYGGHDTGVCAHAHRAVTLWIAGFPEQAVRASEAALALGQRLEHPPSLAHAAWWSATLRQLLREPQACRELAEMAIRIAVEQGSKIFVMCPLLVGWTLFQAGKAAEGLERMQEAVASKRHRQFRFYYDYELLVFAEALLKAGELAHAKGIIAEALEFIATSGNRLFEAEARRLEGEWLAASGGGLSRSAEDCLQAAIATAEQQGAFSFALRAATSLVERCENEDRRREALGELERIYGRFNEGLETPDLQDARSLLRSTMSSQGPA
jgi:class 3 adenylate cyclase/predicted ATPase